MFFWYADCAMGGNSLSFGERINYISDDSVLNHVPLSVSSQNLSLSLPLASHAKPFWLHFWNRLVGHRPQHDRVFCSFPCKCHVLSFIFMQCLSLYSIHHKIKKISFTSITLVIEKAFSLTYMNTHTLILQHKVFFSSFGKTSLKYNILSVTQFCWKKASTIRKYSPKSCGYRGDWIDETLQPFLDRKLDLKKHILFFFMN